MKKSKVSELLSSSVGVKARTKTSFNLDKGLFEEFKVLCEGKGIGQSELIDALLEDLLRGKEEKPKPERAKGSVKPAGKGYADLPGEIRI
jgi:hypothetical protein